MWINVEVWDSVAKDNIQLFRKGATLNGLGTLIFNKWIDKSSGEERKQFKHRLLKVISKEEMAVFEDSDFDLKIAATMNNFDIRSAQESSKSQKPVPQMSSQPVQQMQPNYISDKPQEANQPAQQMVPHIAIVEEVERPSGNISKNNEQIRKQMPPPPPAPLKRSYVAGTFDPDEDY